MEVVHGLALNRLRAIDYMPYAGEIHSLPLLSPAVRRSDFLARSEYAKLGACRCVAQCLETRRSHKQGSRIKLNGDKYTPVPPLKMVPR